MQTFHLDEAGYSAWRGHHPNGFVFNRFGGTNPAYNVLHRSNCTFLSRDVDEGSRTAVEKWCAESEDEIREHADAVLGSGMWKRCGVCFRAARSDAAAAVEPVAAATTSARPVVGASRDCYSLWIDGEPAVWLGSGGAEWKNKVKTAFQTLLPQLPAERPQWIEVEFRFLPDRLYRKDIDNLLTPVLESARDGGWIERGFAWLGSVTARKTTVPDQSQVGASITLSSALPQPSQNRSGILIESMLTRLDESTVKWALYDQAYSLYQRRPDLRFPPQSPMSVEIHVMVDNAAKRKPIVALLKPCIDGLEPILGHPTNLLPEPRDILKRRLAPQDEMVLSLDFHVRGGTASKVAVLVSPRTLDANLCDGAP